MCVWVCCVWFEYVVVLLCERLSEPSAANVTYEWFPCLFNPKARWPVLTLSHLTLQSLSPLWLVRWVWVGWGLSKNRWNLANLSIISGSPSSLLLFLGLLGIKQRDSGLWPTHLLSVTLLILVAMQFSFLSIFYVAKCAIYEEQPLLWGMVKTIKKCLIQFRRF